ncbi:hypothetical protein Tco_0945945 [Tanacetum coccineum]
MGISLIHVPNKEHVSILFTSWSTFRSYSHASSPCILKIRVAVANCRWLNPKMVIACNGDVVEFDVGLGSGVDRGYSSAMVWFPANQVRMTLPLEASFLAIMLEFFSLNRYL